LARRGRYPRWGRGQTDGGATLLLGQDYRDGVVVVVARGPGMHWRTIWVARDRDVAATPGVLRAEVDYVDAVAGVEVRKS
jgi:hypothetical protein